MRAVCGAFLAALLFAAEAGNGQTLTVDVDLVNLLFTVHNNKGRIITNLDRESFAVFEDAAPQRITHFSRESSLPLSIAVLIDASGSVRDELRFEQRAAVEFLTATLRPGIDAAALFTFDSAIELRRDFTDDLGLLEASTRRVFAGGGTRLYDSIHAVIRHKLAARQGRRALIVLTDGMDNCSRALPEDVVAAAQRADVSIHAISVSGLRPLREETRAFDEALRTLAEETGGIALFPVSLRKLPEHFKRLGKTLRSQYTIGYRSTNPNRDGAFRRIHVEVRRKSYSVRVRSGYYAPQGGETEIRKH